MGNTLKATIYKVEASNNNLFFNNFETILKDLASRLDDSGISQNIRVLDEYKNKETSIWFDSFDYNKDFLQNEILRDSICFLLAKDIDFSIIENKEHKKLDSVVKNANTRPKIPSHCVYIPNKNILIMEESTNSATIGAIKRGVEKT